MAPVVPLRPGSVVAGSGVTRGASSADGVGVRRSSVSPLMTGMISVGASSWPEPARATGVAESAPGEVSGRTGSWPRDSAIARCRVACSDRSTSAPRSPIVGIRW